MRCFAIFSFRRGHVVAGGVAVAGVVLLAGPAHAATITVEQATSTVKPGGKVTTIVRATATSCVMRAGKASRTVRLGTGTKVRFVFQVSRTARPGRYKLTVSCDGQRVARTVQVKKSRTRAASRTLVRGTIKAEVTGRTVTAPSDEISPAADESPVSDGPVTADSPEAQAHWDRHRSFFTDNRNGECTQWLFQKRLDFVERVEKFHYAKWINDGRPGPGYVMPSWSGGNWANNATASGIPVHQTPVAGAIMVRPKTPDHGGHVAYVESVTADGTAFTISEMNAPQNGVVTSRTLTVAEAQASGLLFIH